MTARSSTGATEAAATNRLGGGRTAFLDLTRLHPHLLHEEFMRRANNIGGFSPAELLHAYDTAAQCRVQFDRTVAASVAPVLDLAVAH